MEAVSMFSYLTAELARARRRELLDAADRRHNALDRIGRDARPSDDSRRRSWPSLKRVAVRVDEERVTRDRSSVGYALAALGGLAGGGSLWVGWFSFTVPQAALLQVESYAHQFGSLQSYIQEGVERISQHGAFHLTAWEVMTGVPAVLLVVSAIAALVSLLALSGRADGVGRLLAWCGGIALALGAYRLVRPPGPSGVLHPSFGLYLSLIAAIATTAGGLLVGDGHAGPLGSARVDGLPTAPGLLSAMPGTTWSEAPSVPPPSMR
jgi:hypothetical protein